MATVARFRPFRRVGVAYPKSGCGRRRDASALGVVGVAAARVAALDGSPSASPRRSSGQVRRVCRVAGVGSVASARRIGREIGKDGVGCRRRTVSRRARARAALVCPNDAAPLLCRVLV